MIVDRYYYHQLNEQDRAVYRVFYEGVMAHRDVIPIPVRGIFPREAFERIFRAVTNDNPLVYYLNQSACSCANDIFGHYAICPQYFFPEEKVKEYNRKIEKEVNGLIAASGLLAGTDYEKEKKIHDWICQNIAYDYEGADLGKPARVIVSHNIIGVFGHRRAQCEGIAKAVKVLLNAVDVKCIVVTGEAVKDGRRIPHAWNLVNLEGQPYHLDVTWDMRGNGSSFRKISYEYFNLDDRLIGQEHFADACLPGCVSLRQNYFTVNKKVFRMKSQIVTFIENELRGGNTEFCFRTEGKKMTADAPKELEQLVRGSLDKLGMGSKKFTLVINDKIGTCRIKVSP